MIPLLMDFLMDFLSAYRITRLITADTILDGPRDALVLGAYERAGRVDCGVEIATLADIAVACPGGWSEVAQEDKGAPKLAKLISCRWCAGMWVSFGIVIARRRFPRQWAPIAEALALSAGAALIAGLED